MLLIPGTAMRPTHLAAGGTAICEPSLNGSLNVLGCNLGLACSILCGQVVRRNWRRTTQSTSSPHGWETPLE